MTQREHARKVSRSDDVVEEAHENVPARTASTDVSDVDSLLDEIDEVLEENAEDFVKSFVQKGGQ
jgi:prokaryotic ubiquitin-like protein Pup